MIVITDEQFGIGNYYCGCVLWNEDTGEARADGKDFPRALSQVGSSILENLGKSDWTHDAKTFLARLARLLMTRDLWEDGPDAWSVEGLHDDALRGSRTDIEGWDDSLDELRRKIGEEETREDDTYDDVIPF